MGRGRVLWCVWFESCCSFEWEICSRVSCVLSRRMYYYVNTDQENTNITVAMTVRNKWLGTLPLLGHLEYFKVRNFLRTPLLLFCATRRGVIKFRAVNSPTCCGWRVRRHNVFRSVSFLTMTVELINSTDVQFIQTHTVENLVEKNIFWSLFMAHQSKKGRKNKSNSFLSNSKSKAELLWIGLVAVGRLEHSD